MDLNRQSSLRPARWGNLAARAAVVVASIYVMTFSYALYLKAELGSDCVSLLVDGLARTFGLQHGMASNIVNISLLGVMLLFYRRGVGFATIVSAFFSGTFLQTNLTLLNAVIPDAPFALRLVMPLAAAFFNAAGIGLYLAMDLGASPFDGAVLTLVLRAKLSYQNAMYAVSAAFFVAGALLGGVWGYGSVVAVVLSGVLFQNAVRLMQRFAGPLVKKEKEHTHNAV